MDNILSNYLTDRHRRRLSWELFLVVFAFYSITILFDWTKIFFFGWIYGNFYIKCLIKCSKDKLLMISLYKPRNLRLGSGRDSISWLNPFLSISPETSNNSLFRIYLPSRKRRAAYNCCDVGYLLLIFCEL